MCDSQFFYFGQQISCQGNTAACASYCLGFFFLEVGGEGAVWLELVFSVSMPGYLPED